MLMFLYWIGQDLIPVLEIISRILEIQFSKAA